METEYVELTAIQDTPREPVWAEYNQRKAELFRELGHGPEYDRALRELIDELGA